MCIIKNLRTKDKECLLTELEGLIGDFANNQRKIASLFRGIFLDSIFANRILYTDVNRRHRFSLFILLLKESKNLQSDYKLSSEIFKEAYISSDNIYKQINECIYHFSPHEYLVGLLNHINPLTLMNEKEKEFYDGLQNRITIYRGCSEAEVKNGKLGISWTDKIEYAEKYVFYEKYNNKDLGFIIVKKIWKQNVWCVFKHPTDPYFEIIYI